jgi:Family of unknown function (DUF6510)
MDVLDGNAIAGTLFDVFGREMTMDVCTCGQCGRRMRLAELAVYLAAPGVVARCRDCDHVLLVIVDRRGTRCVDLGGFSALEAVTTELT